VLINKAKTSPNGSGPTEAQLRAIMEAALKKKAQGEQLSQPKSDSESPIDL